MLTILCSCTNERPFNSEEWKSATGEELIEGIIDGKTSRELMVTYLENNGSLINQHYHQVQQALGTRQMASDYTIEYLLSEKYRWNIDPEHLVYFVVKFDQDSIVTQASIQIMR
jgi:hypothetical protein